MEQIAGNIEDKYFLTANDNKFHNYFYDVDKIDEEEIKMDDESVIFHNNSIKLLRGRAICLEKYRRLISIYRICILRKKKQLSS